MINIKFIKQSLKPKKEKRSVLITLDDLITSEVQEIFCKSDWYISDIINTFFAKMTPEEKKLKKKYQVEFLCPYCLNWKAIAARVRGRAKYRCQMCNSNAVISAHHRSYRWHGDEHKHLEDLFAICQDCHEKHHFGDKI